MTSKEVGFWIRNSFFRYLLPSPAPKRNSKKGTARLSLLPQRILENEVVLRINYRYVGLLTAGHLVTESIRVASGNPPFLIAEHKLTYGAATGLVFALSMTSSIAQPLFGLYSDRLSKPWLIPIGIFLAGAGLAVLGLTSNYWLSFTTAALSGMGIAAFHPEGARLTTLVSGEKKATAISIFGIGGTLGFALGPFFMITCLLQLGLKGTLILVIPGALLAILMIRTTPCPLLLFPHIQIRGQP